MFSKKILIVDDQLSNLKLLISIFKHQFPSIEVHTALSAYDALGVLLKDDIDFIITDINMPEINGFEFIKTIRSNKRFNDIPVIFLTAENENFDWEIQGLELGAIDFIFKPINVKTFTLKIHNFLDMIQTKHDLIHSQHQLELKTAQLVEQNKYSTLGEMIAMISHQWRQPLAVLSMNAEILKTKFSHLNLEKSDTDFILSRLAIMQNMIQEQSKLIDDFRFFFKPENKGNYFDLSACIDSSLKMLESNLMSNGITLNKQYESTIVFGIEREMMQVVINLVKNAIDQLLEHKIKTPWIKISTTKEQDNHVICLSVEDNGGGIPENIIHSVFEPYISTKAKNGTGLGLHMVKTIINDHFLGKISVSNTEFGACFLMKISTQPPEPTS